MFSTRTDWRLAPNRFTQALEQARASGTRILDLTVSNPTRVGLRYDQAAILGALASPHSLDYDPQSKGLLEARRAVASYYRDQHGVSDADPERIVLTTSTSEGYSFVFCLLCNPGDELLVPKPSYPLFEFLADLQDVKLLPYPLLYDHGWQMDFPSLEKAITPRTRGVVIVHPNNPTGSYVSAGESKLLNAICREHRLAVIVDEVFLDYPLHAVAQNHAGTAAGSPVEQWSKASLGSTGYRSFSENRDVLTFTLSGLSKICALPQLKVAWILTSGPSAAVAAAMARLEVIADTYLSMNAPMQWALPVLLEEGKGIQRQIRQRVQRNLAALDRQLAAQQACQRLSVEGGWYAVVRVPVTQSDEDLAIALLREKSVLVHPGHFYDFPNDGYLVLSLITPEPEFNEGIGLVLQRINT